jgi:hypothetical protein
MGKQMVNFITCGKRVLPIAMSTDNFEKKDNLTLSKARAAVAPLTCNGRKSADTLGSLISSFSGTLYK